jgi:hypothetical protein
LGRDIVKKAFVELRFSHRKEAKKQPIAIILGRNLATKAAVL